MRQARANAADRTPENPSKYLKLLSKIKIGWVTLLEAKHP
jgi:hypothetical protein